jgi:hypothetical protein
MKYVLILDLKISTHSFIFLFKKCISRFSQVLIIDHIFSKIDFYIYIYIYIYIYMKIQRIAPIINIRKP